MFWRLYEKYATLLRFLISGGTAAVVLFTLLYTLTDLLGIWYLASSVIASLGAFVVSFTLHKFWTFADPHLGRVPVQAAGHLTTGLINLGLNTLLLYFLVEFVHAHYLVAQVLVSGVLAVASFFVYKYFIFHKGRYGATPEF
jgi:putative flippase GtrA